MDTSKPTRRVLYRNDTLIRETTEAYGKTKGTFQTLINSLQSQGIPLDDNILYDLYDHEGGDTSARLKESIETECKTQKFPAMADTLRKQLAPLYIEIQKAVDALDAALYHNTYNNSISLDLNHFTVSGLRVGLIEGLDQIIADQSTIYEGADPVLDEVYKRAEKLQADIMDFQKLLKSKGDFITPVGGERPFLNVSIQSGYRVEIEPRALLWIYKKQPKI